MRMAMIASTTMISISVKARKKRDLLVIDSLGEERMILIVNPEQKRKRVVRKEDT
jgi:hypothetical protein